MDNLRCEIDGVWFYGYRVNQHEIQIDLSNKKQVETIIKWAHDVCHEILTQYKRDICVFYNDQSGILTDCYPTQINKEKVILYYVCYICKLKWKLAGI